MIPLIPYGGEFSLVQNFAELHISPSEEIFMVLIFASFPRQDHTHAIRLHVQHHTFSPPIQDFTVLIFAAPSLSAKNAKFCTM
jgi:hypothetical protein